MAAETWEMAAKAARIIELLKYILKECCGLKIFRINEIVE